MMSEKAYYGKTKEKATERQIEQNILNWILAIIIGVCLGVALPIAGEMLIAQLAGHSSADPRHAIFPIVMLMIAGAWLHLRSTGKVHAASWCFQVSFTLYLYLMGQGSETHTMLSFIQAIIIVLLAINVISHFKKG